MSWRPDRPLQYQKICGYKFLTPLDRFASFACSEPDACAISAHHLTIARGKECTRDKKDYEKKVSVLKAGPKGHGSH